MENKEICAECGGVCCKHMGCHYSPDDFKDLTYEGLKSEIDKGCISIDWWEGSILKNREIDSTAYFLRVRNKYSPIVDPSWDGECLLLRETGCPLSYSERPKGARLLIPNKSGSCELKYDKEDCADDWYKYNDILNKLFTHYSKISSSCYEV
ncbi:MAG: hypothetical protein ACRCX2_22575 [Paraclostridium sp.]